MSANPALALLPFRSIWCADFEFGAPDGERPRPVCLVAHELRTGQSICMWQDDLQKLSAAPFDVGTDALFIAYFATAELSCFLSLGWPLPVNILDLYIAFRNVSNGLTLPSGAGLLGALVYFGLDAMAAVEKKGMQELALRNGGMGPWDEGEKRALLAYFGPWRSPGSEHGDHLDRSIPIT